MEEYDPSKPGYSTTTPPKYSPTLPKKSQKSKEHTREPTIKHTDERGPIITKLYCMEAEINGKFDKVLELLGENADKIDKQKEEIKTLREELRLQKQESLALRTKVYSLERKVKGKSERPIAHRERHVPHHAHQNHSNLGFPGAQAPQVGGGVRQVNHRSNWRNEPSESHGNNFIKYNVPGPSGISHMPGNIHRSNNNPKHPLL